MAVTLLLYSAIRIIPVGKGIIALAALMPMSVHQAISLSPDGMVVAVSVMMTAAVVKLCYDCNETLKAPALAGLYVLVFLISQLKIVYLPFGLLYLLIPEERFGGRKKKIIHVGLMAVIAAGSNLAWLSQCGRFLNVDGTNSAAQLAYILHNPLDYLSILVKTCLQRCGSWVETMIGSSLGAQNIPTLLIMVQLYMCLLFYHFVVHHRKQTKQEKRENALFGFVIFSIVFLTLTSEYIQWTPAYNDLVDGVQGRYFIPLLLPLFFTLHHPRVLMEGQKKNTLSFNTISLIVIAGVCAAAAVLFSCLVSVD